MHRLSSSFLLLTSFLLSSLHFILSCTPQTPRPPLQTSLFVYRFDPPAFIEFSEYFRAIREIPFSIPPNCGLFNVYPAPVGRFMAIELSCPSGQTVLLLDTSAPLSATSTKSVTQPVAESDSHFLAWALDGSAIYLKVDSLGSPRVVRFSTDGAQDVLPISEFTYDLAASLKKGEFTFTFSRGLGQGSELWLAKRDGKVVEQYYADPYNYISFARFSPDGKQIAFIKIPDTQTPFTVGEVWVMNHDGSNARNLADADAGHGYAANWAPDGERIAFVMRENPEDERADQVSDALNSNVYVIEVESGKLTQVTSFEHERVETPVWSPDGNTLAFNVVINDRMEIRIADLITGEIRSLITESTCCPAWIRN
jgi:dipeptidyl aminopeptidase/acylaminoacyl peptidase